MLKEITPEQLRLQSCDLWQNQWLVLCSGDFDKKKYNAMTIAWGSIGIMWQMPFVQVVVRPSRFTFEFMEEFDTFTVNAFPERYRSALQILGTKSGRDGDKIHEVGLTMQPSQKVSAPSFKEAELIFECRKMYWDDFKPEHFLTPEIQKQYPELDYHRVYFGEILFATGEDRYSDF